MDRVPFQERGLFFEKRAMFWRGRARVEKAAARKIAVARRLWTAVQDECDLFNSCFADRGA
ncbi:MULTISPECIES: hypothetical protein [Bradyrhizobium]|jgi:hypothetical protein|uniref:hypothetical protein n=1 Tax=Bradyrhizobium TaxID=374 RepID=UPI00117EDCE3|nr:hypothetical protein [Bradyrhizobium japonicum]